MGNGQGGDGLTQEEIKQYPTKMTEEQMEKKLDQEEFNCLRRAGTERPRKGKYCNFFPKNGYFKCKACDFPLYSSGSKFQDQGWDAYDKCFFTGDQAHVMLRGSRQMAEAACANCGSHLGHVFYGEGHTKTNERH
jgi:peptide-methionine (R)-S-oxide reductase